MHVPAQGREEISLFYYYNYFLRFLAWFLAFDKRILHVLARGREKQERSGKSNGICNFAPTLLLFRQKYFPQRGNARSNKRKTNRPSFFRTDFCPITKYFLALPTKYFSKCFFRNTSVTRTNPLGKHWVGSPGLIDSIAVSILVYILVELTNTDK